MRPDYYGTSERYEYNKKWTKNHPDQVKASLKKYRESHRGQFRDYTNYQNKLLRREVLIYYSKGVPQCACCGELIYEFLTVDHIDKSVYKLHKKYTYGTKLIWWIVKNNFPEGFQILCMNCNLAKSIRGICPHITMIQKDQAMRIKRIV